MSRKSSIFNHIKKVLTINPKIMKRKKWYAIHHRNRQTGAPIVFPKGCLAETETMAEIKFKNRGYRLIGVCDPDYETPTVELDRKLVKLSDGTARLGNLMPADSIR